MKLKLMDQRNTNRLRIRHIDREYSSICAKCVQPSLIAEEKHELTTLTRPARQIRTFSVSSFLVRSFRCLRMSLKPNVRAWRNLVSTSSGWKIWATNESSGYFATFISFSQTTLRQIL